MEIPHEPTAKERLRKQGIRDSIAQKTPKERQESRDRLDAEIIQNAADAIRTSFAKAFLGTKG
jgi:hypothetical protein